MGLLNIKLSNGKTIMIDLFVTVNKIKDSLGFTYLQIHYEFVDAFCKLIDQEPEPIYEYNIIRLLSSNLIYEDHLDSIIKELDNEIFLSEKTIISALVNNKSNSPDRTQVYDSNIQINVRMINDHKFYNNSNISLKDKLKIVFLKDIVTCN